MMPYQISPNQLRYFNNTNGMSSAKKGLAIHYKISSTYNRYINACIEMLWLIKNSVPYNSVTDTRFSVQCVEDISDF